MFTHKLHSLSIIYILLFAFFVTSCHKKSNTNFTVEGQLKNIKGNSFYAAYEYKHKKCIDTVTINKDGYFKFQGITDTLNVMSLYFNNNRQNTYIFIDKKWNVSIKGDVKHPDIIEVHGGDINNDLTQFKQTNKNLLERRTDIIRENSIYERSISNLFVECKKSKNGICACKKCTCNSCDSIKINTTIGNDSLHRTLSEGIASLKNIQFKLVNTAADYVKNNPDKIASVILINSFFKNLTYVSRLDEMLNQLKGPAADSPITAELRKYSRYLKNSSEGRIAPYFNLTDKQTNKTISLDKYTGKYLLLSFTSSRKKDWNIGKHKIIKIHNELLKERRKYKKYPNIAFLTLTKDIEKRPLTKQMRDSINWTLIGVSGGWSENTFVSYSVRYIPYIILIGPRGTILSRNCPIQEIINKIKVNENQEQISKPH